MKTATVTPTLSEPSVESVVIELNVDDAKELFTILAHITPGGYANGWVVRLYDGLRAILKEDAPSNTKFRLKRAGD